MAQVSDITFGLAIIGEPEAQRGVMESLAALARPGGLLESFTSRQLVTLTWAFARMQIRPVRGTPHVPRQHSWHCAARARPLARAARARARCSVASNLYVRRFAQRVRNAYRRL